MEEAELKSLLEAFGDLPDPRSERNQEHPLMSILLIALCAVISGADNWVEIEGYGKAKQSWLETVVELPNGIPSHDTFGRVFRFMDPQAFQERFLKWVRTWRGSGQRGVVARDGKQMRGCAGYLAHPFLFSGKIVFTLPSDRHDVTLPKRGC